MKAVIFNGNSINPGDVSWEPVTSLADTVIYPDTADDERIERARGFDGILTDRTGIDRNTMENLPDLKLILKLATGYDNIDLKCAQELGIRVFNIPAYSTDAVAQHAMALILEIACALPENHSRAAVTAPAGYGLEQGYAPSFLLSGKSLGIAGYGNIGKKTAQLAEAFGMEINIYSRDREKCIKSDILSLHMPLTEETYHMIDREFISEMKDGAVIINTARGALIDEYALADALKSGKIAAAGIDVLENEPAFSSPLRSAPNVNITPHIAFAARETRQKLIDIAGDVIKGYIEGKEINRII